MIKIKRQKLNIKNRPVWEKTAGRCWYCGIHLLKPNPERHSERDRERWYTIDHATPRSRGGSDTIENLVPACNRCNGDKSDMTVEEYRVRLIMRHSNVPYFSKTQLEYLASIGVEILHGLNHTFFGEL